MYEIEYFTMKGFVMENTIYGHIVQVHRWNTSVYIQNMTSVKNKETNHISKQTGIQHNHLKMMLTYHFHKV
jgi:hypothetical protein